MFLNTPFIPSPVSWDGQTVRRAKMNDHISARYQNRRGKRLLCLLLCLLFLFSMDSGVAGVLVEPVQAAASIPPPRRRRWAASPSQSTPSRSGRAAPFTITASKHSTAAPPGVLSTAARCASAAPSAPRCISTARSATIPSKTRIIPLHPTAECAARVCTFPAWTRIWSSIAA